ncbi:MAG: DUF1249 domain-containing protein [Pseudomonadota bacterium]|nr:DUF1249 domain-containing protein [Pseudomonadota bacterium]|tara:strand:+ start:2559 stop:3008 length:450 start_codon:yes stop_codon:yes gene_type:complete
MILSKYVGKKEYSFLSLMNSYEGNYKKLLKIVPASLFIEKNKGKSFIAKPDKSSTKLILNIDFMSEHTSILSFSYDYDMNDTPIIYSKLKIYFDSQQVELLNNKEFYNLYIKEFFSRCKYRSLEMSKIRANFYLSLWLDFCFKNNYSFK